MAKPSRTSMFKRLALLQSHADNLPEESIEHIFNHAGQSTGKHDTDEALFRMALEIKIMRLKKKLSYVQ